MLRETSARMIRIQRMKAALIAFLNLDRRQPADVDLSQYRKSIAVSNDTWNKVVGGQVKHTYYDTTSEINVREVGFIDFRLQTGQIGVFRIEEEHRNKGLGKQMLLAAIGDIKAYGKAETVWAVTTLKHPFWSNVWNKAFQLKDPAHSSVTGRGYSMPLNHTV